MPVLQVGDLAPDFDLPALIGGVKKRFRLQELRGKRHVVLAFYPFNWEAVTGKQMMQYQVEREKFLTCGAEVVAISVESIMNTTTWEREIGPFDFPLCSDFWPHGEVAMKYGVLRQQEPSAGACERALLVSDRNGRITFCKQYGLNELPDVQETIEILCRM
jgi:peroxiredoxin